MLLLGVKFESDPDKAALNLKEARRFVRRCAAAVLGDPLAGTIPESKRRNMKKVKSRAVNDDMRPEYDFSGAVRGKYHERFRQSSNVVLLDRDVSEAFPSVGPIVGD